MAHHRHRPAHANNSLPIPHIPHRWDLVLSRLVAVAVEVYRSPTTKYSGRKLEMLEIGEVVTRIVLDC